jgi:single-stranded-DNA-specific exonuclease
MDVAIKKLVEDFLEKTKNKEIQVITHNDTDGITSGAIIAKTLERLNKKFSIKIVKGIDEEVINALPKDKVLLFLDLASNSFHYLEKIPTEIFILDHHEIISEIPGNIKIVNPHINKSEEISGAGICYLFAKELSEKNIDLAYLAIIGMVGDLMEKNPGKIYKQIIKESKVVVKKGLIMYPATRPINKVLEYSSDIYIPNVTGSVFGVSDFLKEIGINKINGKYKNLVELTNEETSRLITAISIRRTDEGDTSDLIGNIYLINFFNKLEDARQVSAMINACSRYGESGLALSFCLQNQTAKLRVDEIYAQYKQGIVKALSSIPQLKKIEERNYLILNAEDKIKDTMIGTIASILSNSKEYEEGKAIIAMAYNKDKIKVSARMVGKSDKNMREILNSVIEIVGGEVGGHHAAAGCLVRKDKENEFLTLLKKNLEIEKIKIR